MECTFRDAVASDSAAIAEMIRHMVNDMAAFGGHAPTVAKDAWDKIDTAIAEDMQRGAAAYVIAGSPAGEWLGVAGAEIATLGGAFATRKYLHVAVLYVVPARRRGGIGARLLERLLDWGRTAGAEFCDLNVLSANPARLLYEKAGFSTFELKMTRQL